MRKWLHDSVTFLNKNSTEEVMLHPIVPEIILSCGECTHPLVSTPINLQTNLQIEVVALQPFLIGGAALEAQAVLLI